MQVGKKDGTLSYTVCEISLNLHYVFGRTEAGRYLFTVVKFIRNGEIRIVTSRNMNSWGKTYFKKRGK